MARACFFIDDGGSCTIGKLPDDVMIYAFQHSELARRDIETCTCSTATQADKDAAIALRDTTRLLINEKDRSDADQKSGQTLNYVDRQNVLRGNRRSGKITNAK